MDESCNCGWKEMNRIKRYALTVAAIFGAQFASIAAANTTQPDPKSNEVLDRVAKIQQESLSQNKAPKFLDNQKISQWNNWSDWQDWSNWYN